MGALDFAGGLVVHLSSGIAALCCALVLGRRKGFGKEEFTPHNLTMTVVGTALLWFGWFGFNAGSSLAANGIAVGAFIATNTAGAAAAMTWIMLEWWRQGRPTALGAATGGVAGLAAVTPGSGFVGPMGAMAIGVVVSVLCYFAITLKNRFHYDDSLDVFGVHGIGGAWGVLAVGIFATKLINPAGANGLLSGGASLIGKQLLGILAVAGFSLVMTFVLLKITALVAPLRVSTDDEETGLDLSQHGEIGYHF
jgi:Amt family ammonium transporter